MKRFMLSGILLMLSVSAYAWNTGDTVESVIGGNKAVQNSTWSFQGANLSVAPLSEPGTLELSTTSVNIGTVTWYYRVTASNDIGETVGSSTDTAEGCAAHTLLAGTTYVTLTWDAVSGAKGYWIYRSLISDAEVIKHAYVTGESYVDSSTYTLLSGSPQIDNNSGGVLTGCIVGLYSRTEAQLKLSTPTAVGLLYYDSSNLSIVISTGTTNSASFGLIYDGTTKPNGW